MDINKIFNLFNQPVASSDINEDYKKHPLYWVGMFKKLILNHNVFKYQLLKSFEKLDDNLSLENANKIGEYMVFNRAWFYIQQVDPLDTTCQTALYKFTDIYLKDTLELAIKYFENTEEYEKCAHLKRNLDFIKPLLT